VIDRVGSEGDDLRRPDMRLRDSVKADGNAQQVGLPITGVRGDVKEVVETFCGCGRELSDVEEGRTCTPSTTEAARPAQISVTTIPDLCVSSCPLTQVAAESKWHGQSARGCMVFCDVQHVALRWMRAANQRIVMLCASLRCSFYPMFLLVNCVHCVGCTALLCFIATRCCCDFVAARTVLWILDIAWTVDPSEGGSD
jgi:hypothetical protein